MTDRRGHRAGRIRFAVPAALLAARRLAMLTRRLVARWCGVIIGEAYQPSPAELAKSAGRPPKARLPGRMRWLLNDVATWRTCSGSR